MNAYKTFINNIELITHSLKELNEKIGSMVKPLSFVVSNISNVVFPKIELPKFNI